MSCWMPSPWTPRIPGAGWIAKEKWQYKEDERLRAAAAPEKVEPPEESRKTSSRAGSQAKPSFRPKS